MSDNRKLLEVENLVPDPGFGCVIRGITMADIAHESIRRQLVELWHQRGLIVFADAEVTPKLQIELSKVFGKLEHHFIVDKIVDGHPELVAFSAYPEKDGVNEVNGELRSGFIPWHMDYWWMPQPNHGGILSVFKMPERDGATGFIDLVGVYDRLPDTLKRRIEHLECVSKLQLDESMFRLYPHYEVHPISPGSSIELLRQRPDDFPAVAQSLVLVQPDTGRKYLNFSPNTAQSVIGMDEASGEALLRELAAYATDETYAYMHRRSMNDMVLWDNLRLLHHAQGVPLGEERVVRRTTILNEGMIGCRLEAGGWTWHEVDAPAAPDVAV